MNGSGSPNLNGRGSKATAIDAATFELATGLSITDMETLGAAPAPEKRAEIAVKFVRHLERQANIPPNKLAGDLLLVLSKDEDRLVRMQFAESIKVYPHLPPAIATRLARDDIDIAAPILRESPALNEEHLGDIVKTMSEPHVLAIADRRPLSEGLVELLIEHKGVLRVVVRLLDNDQAMLSETVLLQFHEWGRFDPRIAERLRRRPNLPFAFVNQGVNDLADQVRWTSLGERTMGKYEATQLQRRLEGRAVHRRSTRGERSLRLLRDLRQEFERGDLKPSSLLAFLRDQDVDRLECGFAVMSGFDIRWVRNLLHGSDRRGLIALCLKAEFTTADYLAFRIALGLAELGAVRDKPSQKYPEKTMEFAREQYEKMRAEPDELQRWLPSDAR